MEWEYIWVVFRIDYFLKDLHAGELEKLVKIKEALPKEEDAMKEVERLNLNSDGVSYFYQRCRWYREGRVEPEHEG